MPAVLVALVGSLLAISPAASLELSIDRGFGAENGLIADDIDGNYSSGVDIAIDASGRMVVVSRCDIDGTHDFCTVRYTTNGARDLTFGTGGIVITDVTGDDGAYAYPRAVAIDSSDRIIVTGECNPDNDDYDFCTVRYTTDGELDPTFGTGGIVITDVSGDGSYEDPAAVAIDSFDRIIVTGECVAVGGYDFCTVRYTTDGELDPTFGTGGIVITDVTGDDGAYAYPRAVAIDSSDRIIVTGECNPDNGDDDFCTVRYTTDGELDPTFGTGGIVITDATGDENYDSVDSVLIDSSDRIVVTGECDPDGTNDAVCLVRYTTDGVLDPSYGDGGTVAQSAVEDDGYWDHIHDGIGAIDSSDRITIVSECDNDDEHVLCAFRFLADGTLDTSWGGGDGAVQWGPNDGQPFEPYAIVINHSGDAVVSGDCDALRGNDVVCVVVLRTAPVTVDCTINQTVPFTDVDESSYAYDAVGCLYELGVTNGTSAITYSPHDMVTREQMAALMARIYTEALLLPCSGEHPFTDVDESSYAYDAVGCLYELGVTNGTSAITYSPHDMVTREQMAALMARMYRVLSYEDCSSLSFFVDVPSASFAKLDIGCLVDIGVTTGTSWETYSPYQAVTREQMAAFLSRMYTALIAA